MIVCLQRQIGSGKSLRERQKESSSWKKKTEGFGEILRKLRQKQLYFNREPKLIKQLKDDQGKYTDEVKTCVTQLMGESDVSAAKVGKVIQTVTSHLTRNKIELSQLPSKTTALRFADIGHALSKIQIFDEIT